MTEPKYITPHYTDHDEFLCENPRCEIDSEPQRAKDWDITFNEEGDACCERCGEVMEEHYADGGPNDHDERMEERRQMGLGDF